MTSVARLDPQLASRTVVWWPVHEYAAKLAAQFGFDLVSDRLPVPGTVGWLELADDDPAKKAAMLVAADHAVLRLEVSQEAMAAASRAIAAADDWSGIARAVLRGRGAYIPRVAS